jgi:hypothetical protein
MHEWLFQIASKCYLRQPRTQVQVTKNRHTTVFLYSLAIDLYKNTVVCLFLVICAWVYEAVLICGLWKTHEGLFYPNFTRNYSITVSINNIYINVRDNCSVNLCWYSEPYTDNVFLLCYITFSMFYVLPWQTWRDNASMRSMLA